MKTIVIANQKGGTGKSSTACHIAFYLAEQGRSVLFINCETQGNSCKTLHKAGCPTVPVRADAFFAEDVFSLPDNEGITVIDGGGFLADVDKAQGRFFKGQLQRFAAQFDFCVIDTPPTANVLQIAPLTAANYVLSPIEMEDYSIDGVVDMLKTIQGVRQLYNPDMLFLGILPSRLKGNSPRQKDSLKSLLTHYPQFVFAAQDGVRLGDRQAIPEALSEGLPVWKLKKTSARDAADEMLKFLAALAEKVGV